MDVARATSSLAPRGDFPILEGVTYLNQASIGLIPSPVAERMGRFEREVAVNGTVSFDDEVEIAVFQNARAEAARLVGAHEDDVAILTSATEALNQLAWWLRPGTGSNVVSDDIEFPSVTYPWLRVSEQTGVEVRLVPAVEDPASLSLERIAGLVDDETAAICVSHVQYSTGLRLDLHELAALARAHDALLIVDATQSAGQVPIDVHNPEIDVVLASAYKWLCGPTGAAFCYVRPGIRETLRPAFVGWRGAVEPVAFDAREISLHPSMRRMEYSTVAYGAGLGLGHSAEYLMGFGIGRILAHNHRLAGVLAEGLEEFGAEILTPRDEEHRAGIVAARLPGHGAGDLAVRLAERGIYVASRFGSVRFSLHLYNDASDVARVLQALDDLLDRPASYGRGDSDVDTLPGASS
jgi:selenocysteine lyase/cysteine desulfurase